MTYFEEYQDLHQKVNYEDDFIRISDDLQVCNLTFESKHCNILPGEDSYYCYSHSLKFDNDDSFHNNLAVNDPALDLADCHIEENKKFRYHIFKPTSDKKVEQFIFLFHGFNEKHWHKYLPWAKRLVQLTGKAVVLFPIAFHMNRVPHHWSDKKAMFQLSERRKAHFPHLINSSLSNVAISTRLHAQPQRYFWSGLQTYSDVIGLITQIRKGEHSCISPEASYDIFAYSIGGLLSQILLMNNPQDLFSNSRLFIFCGGATFNRMSPVTKYILDSETNVALYSFVIEHLDSHLNRDSRLAHFIGDEHPEGICFRSMLNYKLFKNFRESKFFELASRVRALGLEKDYVIPPYEIMNTLQGAARKIPLITDVLDFPYDYKHEEPFPLNKKLEKEVTKAFDQVFEIAGDFLK